MHIADHEPWNKEDWFKGKKTNGQMEEMGHPTAETEKYKEIDPFEQKTGWGEKANDFEIDNVSKSKPERSQTRMILDPIETKLRRLAKKNERNSKSLPKRTLSVTRSAKGPRVPPADSDRDRKKAENKEPAPRSKSRGAIENREAWGRSRTPNAGRKPVADEKKNPFLERRDGGRSQERPLKNDKSANGANKNSKKPEVPKFKGSKEESNGKSEKGSISKVANAKKNQPTQPFSEKKLPQTQEPVRVPSSQVKKDPSPLVTSPRNLKKPKVFQPLFAANKNFVSASGISAKPPENSSVKKLEVNQKSQNAPKNFGTAVFTTSSLSKNKPKKEETPESFEPEDKETLCSGEKHLGYSTLKYLMGKPQPHQCIQDALCALASLYQGHLASPIIKVQKKRSFFGSFSNKL